MDRPTMYRKSRVDLFYKKVPLEGLKVQFSSRVNEEKDRTTRRKYRTWCVRCNGILNSIQYTNYRYSMWSYR